MEAVTGQNLGLSFGSKQLFKDVSITISQGDRIAIVGENGVGKSTLMKVLSGQQELDEGKVVCSEWVDRRYIPQEFDGDETITPFEYLIQSENPDQAVKIADKLGFDLGDTERFEKTKISQLSGGQKRMLNIALVLSDSPMFIFIDEPENHLDIISRQVLIKMLQKHWGAVMFVSHDRYLINEMSNQIVEIEDSAIKRVSSKTYEEYLESRSRDIEREADRWRSEKKDIKKLENAVRILQLRARFNTKGAGVYRSRKRELEKRKDNLSKKPTADRKKVVLPQHDVDKKSGKMIFKSERMCFGFNDSDDYLLKNVDLRIDFGEKIFLVGRNGSGKSTFLRLLLGDIEPTKGQIATGVNIKVEYFSQKSNLDETQSPLWHLYKKGFDEGKARSTLAKLLFNQVEMSWEVGRLSGGQKSRLRFALVFASQPEFIIMDEPTNNLDPTTWEMLSEWVSDFQGTILVVTHDLSFIENFDSANFLVLKDKNITRLYEPIHEVLKSL